MSEIPDDESPERVPAPAPAGLPSARDTPATAGGDRPRSPPAAARPDSDGREAERSKPTPVRNLTGGTPLPESEPEPESVALTVDDERWTVTVVGRSQAGRGAATTPLLLLSFACGDAEPDRQTLVVGRDLPSLTEDELRDAWGRAAPPPDPDRRPPFFPDPRERRRS